MDVLYVVNTGAQSLQWGPAGGNLAGTVPLGFACYRLAALPGNRFLYLTGSKGIGGVVHAWLAVVDTCTNTVTRELDLGVGFGGQCAVPAVSGSAHAHVAISRAVGSTDSGTDGGSNRVATVDINLPGTPTLGAQSYAIPGSPFGTLNLVWSHALNRLYTTHRGDGNVFEVDLTTHAISRLASPGAQATALGLSSDGSRLFVGLRVDGKLVEIGLVPLNPQPAFQLQSVQTRSTMYIAVDGQGRVLVTATRPPGSFPADGILNIYSRPLGAVAQLTTVNTLGHSLGQPAVSPNGSIAYVPRGGQGDVVAITLSTGALVPGSTATVGIPVDVAAFEAAASPALEARPAKITAPCDAPATLVITARDACGHAIPGVRVAAVPFGPISISPSGPQPTPATFQITCTSGGSGSAVFGTVSPPLASVTVPVRCECPIRYCFDFGGFPSGPLQTPTSINVGSVAITIAITVPAQGPRVVGTALMMQRGSVRFQLPAPHTVRNLVVRIKRQDPESPDDVVTVVPAGGQPIVVGSPGGSQRGDWDIPYLPDNITEWTVQGGAETLVKQICFEATF